MPRARAGGGGGGGGGTSGGAVKEKNKNAPIGAREETVASSLEDLIDKHFAILQEALSLHHDIVDRLKEERKQPARDDCSPSSPDASLREPLLAHHPTHALKHQQSSIIDTKEERRTRHSILFPKLDDIKRSLEDAINKPQYHLEDKLKGEGFWAGIVRNSHFTNFVLLVIVLNTLWIAIDTDMNKADLESDAPILFQIIDNIFCSIFAFEILARFFAFAKKKDALMDASFMIDSFLVGLMVWETWVTVLIYNMCGNVPGGTGAKSGSVLRIFRIFRLTRVFRTARLLNSIPELMILVKGMIVAVRSVVSILIMLMLVIYVFAIVFTQLLSEDPVGEGKFENVPQSMNFLLLQVLCGFDPDVINSLRQASWIYYLLFLLYLLLAQQTIMNMLIGILCDVVSSVADVEKDEAFQRDMDYHVRDLALKMDKNGSGTIDQQEFMEITQQSNIALTLFELGVDVAGITDYAAFIFEKCGELTYDDFSRMVSQFRETKGATVKDMMEIRKNVTLELSLVREAIDVRLNMLEDTVKAVGKSRRKDSSSDEEQGSC